MSTENNLTFEGDQFKYKSRVILGQSEVPKMTRFLMSKGIVKNEKQATTVLFLITLISFSLSGYIIYSNFFEKPIVPEMSAEEEMLFQPGLVNTPQ